MIFCPYTKDFTAFAKAQKLSDNIKSSGKANILADKFVIITDSASDLSPERAKEYGVSLIPLTVTVEGSDSVPDTEADKKELYAELRAKKSATTSAINYEAALEAIGAEVGAGNDVLYIGFSSGLSSTASTGILVCKELSEQYPDRKVYGVDSLCASLGEGLLVYLAAKKRDSGASIEEVRDYVEDTKLHLCHWFTVDDLFFLKRGGRVSAATAVVGSMLSIKPVMHVDNEGHLINVGKARGRKASLEALVNKMAETAIDPASQTVFICHGDCIEDAEYTANLIRERLGVKDIMIDYTGAVIGSHSGPGTLAIFFLGTHR